MWRIEKRELASGALDATFGAGGVVTSNPSSSTDGARDIAIDASHMYVVGSDSANGYGNAQWRIEKRSR